MSVNKEIKNIIEKIKETIPQINRSLNLPLQAMEIIPPRIKNIRLEIVPSLVVRSLTAIIPPISISSETIMPVPSLMSPILFSTAIPMPATNDCSRIKSAKTMAIIPTVSRVVFICLHSSPS